MLFTDSGSDAFKSVLVFYAILLLVLVGSAVFYLVVLYFAHKTGALGRTQKIIRTAFGDTAADNSKNAFTAPWTDYLVKRIIRLAWIIVTLGIGKAWADVWFWKYKYSSMEINGKRLEFNATGGELFIQRLLWLVLSVVTLGIYAIFFKPQRELRWVMNRLHFEGEDTSNSDFTGGVIDYFLVRISAVLIIITTIGIGIPTAISMLSSYQWANCTISGRKMQFKASWNAVKSTQVYFLLMNVLTVGWFFVLAQKWAWDNFYTHYITTEQKEKTTTEKVADAAGAVATTVVTGAANAASAVGSVFKKKK